MKTGILILLGFLTLSAAVSADEKTVKKAKPVLPDLPQLIMPLVPIIYGTDPIMASMVMENYNREVVRQFEVYRKEMEEYDRKMNQYWKDLNEYEKSNGPTGDSQSAPSAGQSQVICFGNTCCLNGVCLKTSTTPAPHGGSYGGDSGRPSLRERQACERRCRDRMELCNARCDKIMGNAYGALTSCKQDCINQAYEICMPSCR